MEPPILQQKPQRTFIGKGIKWAFIGFNILMPLWLVFGLTDATEKVLNEGTAAQQEREVINTSVGMLAILFIWLVGAVSLGLLLRRTKPRA